MIVCPQLQQLRAELTQAKADAANGVTELNTRRRIFQELLFRALQSCGRTLTLDEGGEGYIKLGAHIKASAVPVARVATRA